MSTESGWIESFIASDAFAAIGALLGCPECQRLVDSTGKNEGRPCVGGEGR